ncbi:MAG: FG-GAP-like repeat-containing protein, partial [Candidatus Aenigmatarchaeota archaeon]
MKGNTKAMALSMTAIFALSIFAMGAMAAKPQPPPTPPPEPTGNLIITSNPQLVFGTSEYVRLYDWVNGKFSHTWSGIGGNKVVIGDVDNDGAKEVVSRSIIAGTAYFRVWNNGDGSNSPSITVQMPSPTCDMGIGDVDKDGKNELVISGTNSPGSAEVWSCTESTCTKEA